jgi:rsbT co-antagonist protein RsbR
MKNTVIEQFQQLILWALMASAGCAAAFLGIGIMVGNSGTIYSAVVVVSYLVLLLIARSVLAQSRLGGATLLVSGGLVAAALLLTILQPLLWMSYALAPLLAAAVLLQFAPRIPITAALIAFGMATTGIAVIGELTSPLALRPELSIQILRLLSLSATVGFVLYLLHQFRVRLFASLDAVQASNTELATRNEALAEQNLQLEQQMARGAQLLSQVAALESPVTTLADGVLFAPVVGHLTAERSEALRARLLERVHTARARWVLIDLQGVPQMDTSGAGELSATFHAVRLLGAKICLCGITASVASVLTQLGVAFSDVLTARSPQEAFQIIGADQQLGLSVGHGHANGQIH